MRKHAILLFLVLYLKLASAVMDKSVLQPVQTIPYGGTPSAFYTHGNNATSIFVDEKNNTIVAAGEYGNGRFCIFSHSTLKIIFLIFFRQHASQ